MFVGSYILSELCELVNQVVLQNHIHMSLQPLASRLGMFVGAVN